MRTSHEMAQRSPLATLRSVLVIGLAALLATFANTTTAEASPATVDLGDATSFSILADQSITFGGSTTTVTGDIGVSPGTSVTGYAANVDHVSGTLHVNDGKAADAKVALDTAFGDASGRLATRLGGADPTELGGRTLGPGVYDSGDVLKVTAAAGTLTLDGGANDVWIFQSTSSLDFGADSRVEVTGGADPCNVFWVAPSHADLFDNSTVVGTIMALTSVALRDGASIDGRLMSRTADVTLLGNTVTVSTCATTSSSSSGQALRLVKFFFDADGNRVGTPSGDWTVTASVGGSSVIELDDTTISGWANVSGDYTVSEASLEGWAEAGCGGFTLPDIGTAYLDVSGTGDFTLSQAEGAHPVCNQAAGGTPVEVPTRVDTGAGGSAVASTQQVVWLLVAVAAVGALIARRYRFTNDL